jgi:hypothetical protein
MIGGLIRAVRRAFSKAPNATPPGPPAPRLMTAAALADSTRFALAPLRKNKRGKGHTNPPRTTRAARMCRGLPSARVDAMVAAAKAGHQVPAITPRFP